MAAIRDEIHAEVLARGWNEERQAFAQSYGSDELDASVLVMPLVGFLPADDPRFVSTVDAIRRELTHDGLVLRYRSDADGEVDGLPAGEGVFLACSFWLVEVLDPAGTARGGARAVRAAARAPQRRRAPGGGVRPASGRQLGNFPQAFTHLALVEAALALGGESPMREPD